MPRVAKAGPADYTANLGFEAAVSRPSSPCQCNHTLRNLSAAKGDRATMFPCSQDTWTRRQRAFDLAKRARKVRLRGQQTKQGNATTRRLAIMNLAIRGIEADFAPEYADTFRRDLHPDLRADYVLANPHLKDSDWFRKDDEGRWQFNARNRPFCLRWKVSRSIGRDLHEGQTYFVNE